MPAVIVHGGAGRRAPAEDGPELGRQTGLDRAAAAGAERLRQGGSALDAVQAAVEVLEDDPPFNAGTGSVLTTAGEAEMDAAVMTGDGGCGAVANLARVRHPIAVARAVMERTDHVMLVGAGALAFARAAGFPDWDPVTPERRERWERVCAKLRAAAPDAFDQAELRFWRRFRALAATYLPVPETTKLGTVGAAACDARGGVAAATSTGGIWFKLPGRVGDTPLFGAGTWAGPLGAASATGHGEGIIRLGLTRTAVEAMRDGGAQRGVEAAVAEARRREVECGLIAVDAQGGVGAACNAEYMGTARVAW
jgi:beta-aspartyl-peptidase (threonine type)